MSSGTHSSRLESHLLFARVLYAVVAFSDTLTPLVLPVARRGPPCAMSQLGCSSPPPSASEPAPPVREDFILTMKLFPFSISFLKLRAFSSGLCWTVAMNIKLQAVSKSPNRRGGGTHSVGRGCQLNTWIIGSTHHQRISRQYHPQETLLGLINPCTHPRSHQYSRLSRGFSSSPSD